MQERTGGNGEGGGRGINHQDLQMDAHLKFCMPIVFEQKNQKGGGVGATPAWPKSTKSTIHLLKPARESTDMLLPAYLSVVCGPVRKYRGRAEKLVGNEAFGRADGGCPPTTKESVF